MWKNGKEEKEKTLTNFCFQSKEIVDALNEDIDNW